MEEAFGHQRHAAFVPRLLPAGHGQQAVDQVTGEAPDEQLADDERRLGLLRKSAKGQWIGSISLSEPTAGSDLAGVQTRAVREGDEWVITGTKRWAGFAEGADFIEVLARTRDPKDGEPRSAGLEPFLLATDLHAAASLGGRGHVGTIQRFG